MEKFKIIREMLGDDVAAFIADDLRKSYYDLTDDTNLVPFFSEDIEEEIEEKLAFLKAFRKTYTWYATDQITDEETIDD